ncbi:hypothetical protein H7347_09350 [Corynebacterium sp. zg-331]|uniref:hypothetical protein n=1 Tax=unclassified Corynebacterium TaxID=2624378 RepID=UPI00128C0C4A|nr:MULTISPECIES: hypothetical protein [unclassified Corynebacterium]MBC3186767.1 hypothetical protein [Corynebacterium sp. zg-331]
MPRAKASGSRESRPREGAQASPAPRVPGAMTIVGRGPFPTQAVVGSRINPETAVGAPVPRVEE